MDACCYIETSDLEVVLLLVGRGEVDDLEARGLVFEAFN